MVKNIELLSSLKENASINLNQEVDTWEDAVKLALQPLLKSGAIESKYIDSIIKSTNEYGPYYIISDNIAMPHSRPEDGVNKDAFTLLTLTKPVKFKGDNREIRLLIGLAATSADIHVSSALPQVVATFEDPEIVKKILDEKSIEGVQEIISKIDSSKYLS